MEWRHNELAHFGNRLTWLSGAESAAVYDGAALPLTGANHNGLDPSLLGNIERLDVSRHGLDASGWLSQRIAAGPLLMIFDRRQVCRVDGAFFADNWQDLLCPSRDDALILASDGDGVLFYSHEDEFEFALRRRQ